MPTHWKLDLTLIPLVGGALSLGVIRGSCVPGGSLGSLFAMGGAVVSPSLLFGLGLLSPGGQSQIFPIWSPLEESWLMIIPETFASNVLPPQ